MKNLKKISKEKLRSIKGAVIVCPKGMVSHYCPDDPTPQCYWKDNVIDCRL